MFVLNRFLNIASQVFLELPSVHKFTRNTRKSLFRSCPLLSFLEWTLVHPLLRETKDISAKDSNDVGMEDGESDFDDCSVPYSKLHYGFLNYLALQRKKEEPKVQNLSRYNTLKLPVHLGIIEFGQSTSTGNERHILLGFLMIGVLSV